jgi:hypothetical protein
VSCTDGFKPKDENRLDLSDEKELQGWADRLGVSVATLVQAAHEVSIEIDEIKKRLQIVVGPAG